MPLRSEYRGLNAAAYTSKQISGEEESMGPSGTSRLSRLIGTSATRISLPSVNTLWLLKSALRRNLPVVEGAMVDF